MATPGRTPATAIDSRRTEAARDGLVLGGLTRVQGFISIAGSGETSIDVNFPVLFVEKPLFLFGHELEANEAIVAGNFPTCSASVLRWNLRNASNSPKAYYVGATIIAVVLGHEGMRSILHWSVEGNALSNPTIANENV